MRSLVVKREKKKLFREVTWARVRKNSKTRTHIIYTFLTTPCVVWWFLEKPLFVCLCLTQVCVGSKTLALKAQRLTSETVQGSALSLKSIDNIKSSDSLSSGVLSVGDGISDDVLKEDLKDTTGLFVDKTRDTLDATSSCQSSDGRLGDALDVISQDLSVTLGTTLS